MIAQHRTASRRYMPRLDLPPMPIERRMPLQSLGECIWTASSFSLLGFWGSGFLNGSLPESGMIQCHRRRRFSSISSSDNSFPRLVEIDQSSVSINSFFRRSSRHGTPLMVIAHRRAASRRCHRRFVRLVLFHRRR